MNEKEINKLKEEAVLAQKLGSGETEMLKLKVEELLRKTEKENKMFTLDVETLNLRVSKQQE